jgi:hypothetical protein
MLEGGKTNKERKKRIVERKEWDWLYVDTAEDVSYEYNDDSLETLREEII